MMTSNTWMFLSSFEKIRSKILEESTIVTLVRPELHAFFDSAYVSICAFVLFQKYLSEYKGAYIDLTEFYGANIQGPKALEIIHNYNKYLKEE